MRRNVIEILTTHKERFTPPKFNRAIKMDVNLDKVQTITGPRRVGKSSLMKLTIQQLLDSGVTWDKICFITLEDERLRGEAFEPDEILQAFAEMYPQNPLLKEVYFFFDEVQHLNHWESFVNRVHEQVSRKVMITGSNSKLLHTEVAGVLRGRGLPTELLPLSFTEYLDWKAVEFSEYGSGRTKVMAAFKDYLFQGGYPETVLSDEKRNTQLLQEYFNAVLYRDIIDMNQPANYSYLRYLFHRIAANTGKPTSFNKIHRELKSRGYAVGKDKVYEMADLAESVYLYKSISKFDFSLVKRENADKKNYFIDNGMLRALNSSFSGNYGMLLENLVFWQLYRQYGSIYTTDIYYYKDQTYECDYILYKEGGKALPVQVCWSIDVADTKDREIKALSKACRMTDNNLGVIITYETEGSITVDAIRIEVIPAWKWCAQELDLFNL